MFKLYRPVLAGLIIAALASCSTNEERYLLPPIDNVKTYRSSVRTVEVTRLDLPAYAEDSEISVLGEDGVLRPTKSGFWADAPDRALTELLAAGLDQSLSASVAAEPWPFETPPDVQVEIKVHNLSGIPGQVLTLAGQYFLTSPAHGHLERAHRFSFAVPMADDSLTAVAAAQSQAVKLLVEDIARRIAS